MCPPSRMYCTIEYPFDLENIIFRYWYQVLPILSLVGYMLNKLVSQLETVDAAIKLSTFNTLLMVYSQRLATKTGLHPLIKAHWKDSNLDFHQNSQSWPFKCSVIFLESKLRVPASLRPSQSAL